MQRKQFLRATCALLAAPAVCAGEVWPNTPEELAARQVDIAK